MHDASAKGIMLQVAGMYDAMAKRTEERKLHCFLAAARPHSSRRPTDGQGDPPARRGRSGRPSRGQRHHEDRGAQGSEAGGEENSKWQMNPVPSAFRGAVGSSMATAPETGTTPRDVGPRPGPAHHAGQPRCRTVAVACMAVQAPGLGPRLASQQSVHREQSTVATAGLPSRTVAKPER
jgi:hypothetical protein